MKLNANWVRVIIGIFALLMLSVSLATGESIDENGYKWTLGLASVTALILLIFEKWAWRWPIIRSIIQLFGYPPIVHGTWKGELAYTKDAKGKAGTEIIYIVFLQTFTELKIKTYTAKSPSYSNSSQILKTKHKLREITYSFTTVPPDHALIDNRSTNGFATLSVIGNPVKELVGSYYTNRNGGAGSIKLTAHTTELADSFSKARTLKFKDSRKN